ncbi:MAG: EAL domain-containing protein [Spirochaetes bacterium]|nr:EAL domain-containing protein [Spirochaetota bacterium]
MTIKKKRSGSGSKTKSKSKYDSYSVPVLQEEFNRIKKLLMKNSYLKILLIDASKINRIEFEYGKQIYREVLDALCYVITSMRENQLRKEDIITVNHHEGDQYYIFLSRSRMEKKFQSNDLENVAERIMSYINKHMFGTVYSLIKKRPTINVGYAITVYNPLVQEERLIDKLIEDAKIMAHYKEFKASMRNKEKLQELIIKEEIKTIYQPIVNLINKKIIGYEALTRGPKNTEYENPYVLFNIAEETGLLFELDRICRRQAFINAKGIAKGAKLFVNILPSTIHDPVFRGKYLKDFLSDLKINPHNIVLEVSERQVIENFEVFKKASQYYSDIGFAIAIDDTGTGYSNLQSLIKLKLQYIKVDISLIRNVNRNSLKQKLVKALSQLAETMKADVIAEGIETKEEMDVLIDLGVLYGQGFLFARPAPPFPGIAIIKD